MKIEEMKKTPAVSPMPEKTKGILIKAEKEADRALERTGLELTGMTLLLMYKNRAEQVGIVQEAEKNVVCSSLNNQKIQRLKN